MSPEVTLDHLLGLSALVPTQGGGLMEVLLVILHVLGPNKGRD